AVSRLISYALFEGRPLTTRGQWINPLVFALSGTLKALPQIKKVEKPIFIIGMGRSGTTILGVVMSMHRDVGFLNEPKALWHSIYPMEDVIGNYTLKDARYRLHTSDASEQVRRDSHRLFGAYLAAVFSRRLVDKYPELVFRVPFVRAIFPDAKFVFITRNGWDVCSSVTSWSKDHSMSKADEVHDWWGVNRRKWDIMLNELVKTDKDLQELARSVDSLVEHSDMSAVEWIVTMRKGLKQKKLNPGCIYTAKLEDLRERPGEVLGGILEFCELEQDNVFLDYAEKTLKPTRARDSFELDTSVRPLFEQTMKELGY
ncbi:hypothetical protein LCGC14_2547500, partial [marine sediment metagenome]